MHLLETLGQIRLTDGDGREIDRLLRQPKRLGLLAYLAAPAPGTWHRRDVLLGVFWPELNAQRARNALRNALHVLRQHVGDDVIRTRGDDEVSVDPSLFATDAFTMEQDAAVGRASEAFERYRGDYLRGLYMKEAETFERWLDDERRRLLTIARRAGLAAADTYERSGNTSGAVDVIQRVAELDPHDESVVRRVIGMFDRAGDRARALAAYERFSLRLSEDLNAEPSADTLALVEAIRVRRSPKADVPFSAPQPIFLDAPAPAEEPAQTAQTAQPAQPARRSPRWSRLFVAAAGIIALVFVALRGRAGPRGERLVILPMENNAADSLAYIGPGINDEVARIVRGIGGLRVRSAAHDVWPRAIREDLPRIGKEFGANVALRTALSAAGDSLVLTAELVDIGTNAVGQAGRYAFVVGEVRDVGSRLAATIAGKLFRADLPNAPHARSSESSESFRLAIAGWYQLFNKQDALAAKALFNEATEKDPSNARAWAGLSSVWSSLAASWGEEWSIAADLAEAAGRRALALDATDGTPLANTAALRALKSRRVSDAESLFARAIALDPANPELYAIKAGLYRDAGRWNEARDEYRIARQLDPLLPVLVEREAVLELCAGRPKEALVLARAGIDIDPTQASLHRAAGRALARLGRWNDAVAEIRLTNPSVPSAAANDSSSAASEAVYWAIAESAGRAALTRLEDRARTGWVAPVRLAITHIAAGDIDGGMSLLEREIGSGDPGLYRLACQAQVDRVRGTPRLNAILAALPKWEP